MRARRHLTLPRLLLYLAGAVVVVLVLAQLLLPRIAESRIRSRLDPYGEVHSVHVSAWPAIELLWGDADSAAVKAGALALSTARAASLLHEAKGFSEVSVTASSVRLGKLQLTDATLHKHGGRLTGSAMVSGAAVKAALPAGVTLKLLGSEGGKVSVQATGALFGVGATLGAIAEASDGKIVVHPSGPLLGGVRLTLYSDPRVSVLGVSARAVQSDPPIYRVGLTARLR
ncbi:MAG TPA: LmeA family phospholipid-binding protein [Solirubrobacteraceae bacterium]|nr:LmeA family phospholipid-binding protein [Solirubrobacteraceae bacterium]